VHVPAVRAEVDEQLLVGAEQAVHAAPAAQRQVGIRAEGPVAHQHIAAPQLRMRQSDIATVALDEYLRRYGF